MHVRPLRLFFAVACLAVACPSDRFAPVQLGGVPLFPQHTACAADPTPAPDTPDATDTVADQAVVPVQCQYHAGVGSAGRCDVYVPRTPAPKSGFPAVLVIHGGGWATGDKWTMGTYCQNLTREGCVAVNINYRHAPTFKFPAQADDVRQALVWMVQSHETYSIDVNRIGVFGYSAGGHMGALIGLLGDADQQARSATSSWPADDPRWEQLPQVKAICAGGPPCDFRSLPPDNTTMSFFLGGSPRERPEVYQAASPITHVTSGDPPVQLIHGETDFIVPLAGSQAMHQALQAAGIDSHLEIVPSQGHLVTFLHPTTNATMIKFFRRVLLTEAQTNP